MAFGDAVEAITQTDHRLKLQKFRYSENPLQTFLALSNQNDYCYLLESAEGPRKLAQYSFLGFSPSKVVESKNGRYTETSPIGDHSSTIETRDPFPALRKVLAENFTTYHGFRFVGGLVGYFSYDAIRYIESLAKPPKEDSALPDLEFGVYDDGIVFDHLTSQAYYYWYNNNRIREIERLLEKKPKTKKLVANKLRTNITQEKFETMVHKVKRYISAGDIFQAVLSKRFEFSFKGDLIAFYQSLRDINPSPYMYFLKMKGRAIVGSSPEMLGRVEGNRADTFPIAGTRPIGKNTKQDDRLADELLHDPKERAEHVMLIDLARNDLGKVCEFGTVTVPEFMAVQKYSHVQHIVSRVSGQLRPHCDAIDTFRAIFPAGTVSGAPKKRAMEIIDELEPCRRGPYAGAVGYFSYNGNADFAITIRTLVANGSLAYIQAGAGIVADSDPTREWFETEQKANALLHALKLKKA
ncbi:MAG: anthranilate synthase component I [Candidatus Bathyarchaeia archaeon]